MQMDMAKFFSKNIFRDSIRKREKIEEHKNQIRKSTGDITMIINGKKIKAKDLAKQAEVSRSTVIKYYDY